MSLSYELQTTLKLMWCMFLYRDTIILEWSPFYTWFSKVNSFSFQILEIYITIFMFIDYHADLFSWFQEYNIFQFLLP